MSLKLKAIKQLDNSQGSRSTGAAPKQLLYRLEIINKNMQEVNMLSFFIKDLFSGVA